MLMGQVKMKSKVLCIVYVVEVKFHMVRLDMIKDLDGDMNHGR